MSKRFPRPVSLRHYVSEVLKNAAYEKGEKLDVIVAEAPDLPGCLTQGATFEEARENLDEAIEMVLEGQDLLSASQSSLDLWNNPLDDEDWNNAWTKLDN